MADEKSKTEEQVVRTSKISKRISRTFKIGDYKSLVVDINFEEDVTWKDMNERNKKSENITKLLLKDFQNTTNEVFKELGVSEKKAVFIDSSPQPKSNTQDIDKSVDVLLDLGDPVS
jgi:thymidylate kinase